MDKLIELLTGGGTAVLCVLILFCIIGVFWALLPLFIKPPTGKGD
jgi:hypothetical protein